MKSVSTDIHPTTSLLGSILAQKGITGNAESWPCGLLRLKARDFGPLRAMMVDFVLIKTQPSRGFRWIA
jgi:hypothetical protein